MKLDLEFASPFYKEEELCTWRDKACLALETLKQVSQEKTAPVGWFTLPHSYDREEVERIKAAACRIRKSCDVFVVIGVGGSFLGARAVIEFLQGKEHNALRKNGPAIYFAGTDLDPDELARLLSLCENKEICLNVISKSGTTTEPAVAFRFFRQLMEKKYGEKAAERIFITTDKRPLPGTLREFSEKAGYECFTVPQDIGGRYSVLTPVGLLPIAVSGADVDALLRGAAEAEKYLGTASFEENPALQYAALRNLFYSHGKMLELFSAFSASGEALGEWNRQLFGESEGKDGKGLFPAVCVYSRDLHSVGQYVQEGERLMFETLLLTEKTKFELAVPTSSDETDGLSYLAGRPLSQVNKTVVQAVCLAHRDGGCPVLCLTLPDTGEESLGYALYFFMISCAVSGYALGVDPFNQPGVEQYKKNMFRLLGKPGYAK